MRHHWENLKYLVIHKWHVLVWGLKLRVWWHQLILHDWTKLMPAEWFSDARHHHARHLSKPGAFLVGRLHHLRWNPHHWQYWVVPSEEEAKPRTVKIPDRFIREMIADWIAAGRAKNEPYNARQWYEQRRQFIHMHGESRDTLEHLLRKLFPTTHAKSLKYLKDIAEKKG